MSVRAMSPAAVAECAAAAGVVVETGHLELIAGALGAIGAAVADPGLAIPFEAEPAQFLAVCDRQRQGAAQ
jgi:hypothetical protein